jgi:hypothetical protein
MIFRYTFPLGAIDGGSVEKKDLVAINTFAGSRETFLSGDRWVYSVHLDSSSKGIISQDFYNSEPMIGIPGPKYGLSLDFPDEALAQRVLAAFRHAADLCRSKEVF